MTEPDELQRLRRQVRAMASLNEQLRARVEALSPEGAGSRDLLDDGPPPPLGAAPRRGRRALDWADEDGRLGTSSTTPAFVVARPDDGVFVIDGGQRRRVRSGLLAAALEQLLGERRAAADEEFSSWPEGAPIEVLEAPTGTPFVVVGDRRLPVNGLPLPHPVAADSAARLTEGPSLDLLSGVAARRAGDAIGWSEALAAADAQAGPPELVTAGQTTYVLEGGRRRAVTSPLLVPALEAHLGARQLVAAEPIQALEEGPPVAILESSTGAPFVVVGGRRLPVRGLPLPYPIVSGPLERLFEGPPLDLGRSLSARRANEAAGWAPESGREAVGSSNLFLAVDPDRTTWLVEGSSRRQVAGSLLISALEGLVGPRRPVSDGERDEWEEANPVVVLESRTGPPFVVVDGVRHPIRSLPLPHPVDEATSARLTEGPALDLVRAVAARRADQSLGWLDQLGAAAPGAEPVLVVGPDSVTWVLEANTRRQVRAALLLPALEDLLGPPRDATAEEMAEPEGVPVEVLESRTGPPFLVVGGVRHPLRALPLPVAVDEVGAVRLPEGAELDVAVVFRQLRQARKTAAELAAARAEELAAGPDPIGEIKAYLVKKKPG